MVNHYSLINRKKLDKLLGIFLLSIFFIIGILTIFWRPFIDEADNLVTGWLISQGEILYTDIFSHHFPFAYYWVAFIITLFGKSIFIVRLSVLIFQTILFGIAIYYYQKWTTIGLVAVCWAIFRLFYRGNVVLYSSFSGPALFVIFIITISIYQRISLSKKTRLLLSALCGIAFLSDPLSIYPITIMILFILLKNPRKGLLTVCFFTGFLVIILFFMIASKSLINFYQDAIYFNQFIYSKYVHTSALRIRPFFETVIYGLNITDSAWLNFDPFYQISLQSTKFDTWAFTGLFYRIIIIFGSILLMIKKEYRTAWFIYLFSAASITISAWEFRAQAFVLISLFIACAIILGDFQVNKTRKLLSGINLLTRIAASIILFWGLLRSTTFLFQNHDQFLYSNTFANYETTGRHIKDLACNSPNVKLIDYPGGLYINWFSGLKPISRYSFMWPWVAEIGLPEVTQALSQTQIEAIVIREESVVWGLYDTRDFLLPLDKYLQENYKLIENNVYLSPELAIKHNSCK